MKNFILTLYEDNLNWYPPRSTVNACGDDFVSVSGFPTPTPAAWDDVPKTISFHGAVISYSQDFQSCVYTSDTPGGELSCPGTKIQCLTQTDSVLFCNAVPVEEWSVKALLAYPVEKNTVTTKVITTVI